MTSDSSDPVEGPERLVLSEQAAVEVLAYLVSAARTQVDEAAEYGPLRLLTAAQRLGEHLAPGASAPVRRLLASLDAMAPTATPTADRDAYIAALDAVCRGVADCLLELGDAASS